MRQFNWQSGLVLGLVISIATPIASFAQSNIVPDSTLGAENSTIIQNFGGQPVEAIAGGAQRGANLFHSFREFNVSQGRGAYFLSPNAAIQNILARVTGANPSEILGKLGTLGASQPNLFLINPNGIIFGAEARLDMRGSFVATTAPHLNFPDGSQFSATNPQAAPLLTVNITPGLQYGRGQAPITQAGNLTVGNGQSLTLIGNTVTNTGGLTAPGGRVEVLGDRVALLDQAAIDVSAPGGGGTVLIGGDFQGQGIVPTASRVFVAPNVVIQADAIDTGNGGTVIVWSDEATRFYGKVSAKGGETSGNGGFVEVSGKQFLDYRGAVNTFAPNGLTGTLLLDPTNITVVAGANNPPDLATNDQFADPGVNNTIANGTINAANANVILQATNDITFTARIDMLNLGVGLTAQAGNNIIVQDNIPLFAAITTNGGDINLSASNNILFQGSILPLLGSVSTVVTNGGNINLSSGADTILNSFAIRTDSQSGGNSGDITITTGATGRLILQNRGVLFVDTTGNGTAGNITIQANEVNLSGSGISVSSSGSGTGNAGRLLINAGRLAVNNSSIQAFTNNAGNGGEISVQANQIELDGQGNLAGSTVLFAGANSTTSTGRAGTIALDTQRLSVRGGAGIYAGTVSSSDGGSLTVRAAEIEVSGTGRRPSTLSVGALADFGATGDAGTMQIVTDRLTVRDGAIVDVSALRGQAGNLSIQANTINLVDGGIIDGEGQRGGNVTLDTAQLQVKNASFISVGTLLGDVGGSLQIRARESVTVQDSSSISTSSINGRAGDLQIETRNLTLQNLSIVASSTLGIGSAGNVTVRAADTVLVEGSSSLGSNAIGSSVTTGNLLVETGTLTIQKAGGVSTALIGQGRGGDISVKASNLIVQDSGFISTSVVGQGQGGNLAIEVDNSVSLNNRGVVSTSTFGAGSGGSLSVSAKRLDVLNQSSINTVSFDRIDNPARTDIFGDLQLGAIQSSPFLSGVFNLVNTSASNAAATAVQGNAGELTVQVADTITLANRGSLATVGAGTTNGAKLSVRTGELNLLEEGGLRSDIVGQGRGGDIDIQANNLRSQNGVISSRGAEFGTAANITVSLNGTLNSSGGQILASSTRSGGGNIDIAAGDIRLRDGSLISTSVFDSTGGGGNINIRSNIFLALEDSDILANAELGAGGNILINSPVFLAALFSSSRATPVGRNPGSFARFRGNGRVDISAESRSGSSGTVIYPTFDPSRGLAQLPVDLVDPTQLISQACVPRGVQRVSSLTVTGRGGIAPSPTDPLQSDEGFVKWVEVKDEGRQGNGETGRTGDRQTAITASTPSPITEAQGLITEKDGSVWLVAGTTTGIPQQWGLLPLNCHGEGDRSLDSRMLSNP